MIDIHCIKMVTAYYLICHEMRGSLAGTSYFDFHCLAFHGKYHGSGSEKIDSCQAFSKVMPELC